jgi:hypothetical protein
MNHSRPPAWRNLDALRLPNEDGDSLELLLLAILQRNDSNLNTGWRDALVRKLHSQLEQGSGAIRHDSALLAGLDQGEFYRVFRGLCHHLGQPVAINLQGDTIKEVKDSGRQDLALAPARGYMTNQELAFHSDRADVTLLACWNRARRGGEFRLASSSFLVDAIERSNPAWLNCLRQPIPHDLRGEGSGDEDYCLLPILTESTDNFVLRYIRKFNDSTVRHGVDLPASVREMLDGIDALLESPGASVEFAFHRGMLVMVNNHTTLHSRRAFVDGSGPKRSLLRCWLASSFTRSLPESFRPLFHNIRGGQLRGGVIPRVKQSI